MNIRKYIIYDENKFKNIIYKIINYKKYNRGVAKWQGDRL